MKRLFFEKREILILAILLAISGVSHAYNMFHYPYYENDEGTYISQAWSLLRHGTLAPYTYWYDHAPVGWFMLAVWFKIIGGFFTFGTSIDTGRVFMLVVHLASSFFLFQIAKRLTGRMGAGIIAVLLFSLSPLALYFQRLVLLDNMMIFWVLVSLYLLLTKPIQLLTVMVSAVFFGISVLTKESAIFFFPAYMYLLAANCSIHNKKFAMILWPALAFFIISSYFVFALLKSELFPTGFLGDNSAHVSLISTLQDQLARGAFQPFWVAKSDFYKSFIEWFRADKFSVLLGICSFALAAVLSIKVKNLRLPVLLVFLYLLFLLRGKLVISFYIIPLIPLISLLSGVLIDNILFFLSHFVRFLPFRIASNFLYLPAVLLLAFYIAFVFLTHPIGQYKRDETTAQRNALAWIKDHLRPNTHIIIDNWLYVDLHEAQNKGEVVFSNADWFWKVEKDPEVYSLKLSNDWKNIEYIALSHDILKKIKDGELPLIRNALNNSTLVSDWTDSSTQRNIRQYESSNGNWMSVYMLNSKDTIAYSESWEFYKKHFIHSYGQVIDPSNGNTTSEGQSYAMLRSVWQNDRKTFDGVWAWTTDHMQYRADDKLLSWLWKNNKLEERDSAADADQDIALALLFAYKKWQNKKYLSYAKDIIASIWGKEVKRVGGNYIIVAGTNSVRNRYYLVNPSYWSPASYRIFAAVDLSHPWDQVADDVYSHLSKISKTESNAALSLPPNWILVDQDSGAFYSAADYVKTDSDYYGYDAFRLMWRIAQDAIWFKNSQAHAYLAEVKPFFAAEWRSRRTFASLYTLDGTPKVSYGNLSVATAPLAAFFVTDQSLASEVYNSLFKKKLNDVFYWGDKNNYYDQSWAWFATALYKGKMQNLFGSIK